VRTPKQQLTPHNPGFHQTALLQGVVGSSILKAARWMACH